MSLTESDTTKDAAIEKLQKQINNIVQELNLLKEQQALQTSKLIFLTFDRVSIKKANDFSGNYRDWKTGKTTSNKFIYFTFILSVLLFCSL